MVQMVSLRCGPVRCGCRLSWAITAAPLFLSVTGLGRHGCDTDVAENTSVCRVPLASIRPRRECPQFRSEAEQRGLDQREWATQQRQASGGWRAVKPEQ